ncbi:helix-turn-helix domain-containing protein [Paenibacillus sp. 2TAB23]|uniref:helix-turn-helix domain-containing protein n=1 Tax=Paenibacillus sp. 2TAB23 TaxID=3233004 RepID=UPI003F99014D
MDNSLDDEIKEIGISIKKFRSIRKLTQSALSEKVGLSLEQIQKIEQGRGSTKIKTLFFISKALEIKPEQLFSSNNENMNLILDRYQHLSKSGQETLINIAGEIFKLESTFKGGIKKDE